MSLPDNGRAPVDIRRPVRRPAAEVSATRRHLTEALARRVAPPTRAALGEAAVQAGVARILDGAFKANVAVSNAQMAAYADLLHAVAGGLDAFVNTRNDEEADDGD